MIESTAVAGLRIKLGTEIQKGGMDESRREVENKEVKREEDGREGREGSSGVLCNVHV